MGGADNLGLPTDDKSTTKSVFRHEPCRGSGEDERAEKARKPELERLRSELAHLLPRMAKHEIEELTTQIRQVYFKRFHKRKTPKYGSLNKGFTSQELQAFFRVIDDERLKLLFAYQSQRGLRIGEVCKLHLGRYEQNYFRFQQPNF